MRKKERFISILLMGTLAFSLAACTGTKESSSAAASSSSEVVETASSSVEVEEVLPAKAMAASSEVDALLEELMSSSASSSTKAASASSSSAVSTSSSVSTSSVAASGDRIFGSLSGTEYTNTAFNFRFTPSGSWDIADDAEMLEHNEMEGKQWNDTDKMEAIKGGKTFYDLYATCENPYQNALVVLKDAVFDVNMAGGIETLMDEDVRSSVEKELTEQGYENCKVEKGTATFLGDPNTPVFRVTAELYGMKVYETMVFVTSGHYFATITTASLTDDTTQDVLNMFTKLK
uniref:PsbP C-terminal domain-containing protein n=1 Tax=Eubacterium cellulosolvens (strain ATCC 43171 / JCM 9499 / 6) TaxID=633697 RepID=I5ASD2_EUBC6